MSFVLSNLLCASVLVHLHCLPFLTVPETQGRLSNLSA